MAKRKPAKRKATKRSHVDPGTVPGDEAPYVPGPERSRLLSSMTLAEVRLSRVIAQSDHELGKTLESLNEGEVSCGGSVRLGLIERRGETIWCLAGADVWAPGGRDLKDASLRFEVDRVLRYSGVPESVSDETVRHFALNDVPVDAWPYLRADINRLCIDMSVPPLLLPLWTSPPVQAPHPTEAGSKE